MSALKSKKTHAEKIEGDSNIGKLYYDCKITEVFSYCTKIQVLEAGTWNVKKLMKRICLPFQWCPPHYYEWSCKILFFFQSPDKVCEKEGPRHSE